MQVETVDQNFNNYLQSKTKYDIDIFKSFFHRVDKVIVKGRITSDTQFYDVNIMVDQLCQTVPVNNKKIEILNKLLIDYEQRISRKQRRQPPNSTYRKAGVFAQKHDRLYSKDILIYRERL